MNIPIRGKGKTEVRIEYTESGSRSAAIAVPALKLLPQIRSTDLLDVAVHGLSEQGSFLFSPPRKRHLMFFASIDGGKSMPLFDP